MAHGTIARVFVLGRRADEAPAQQELHAGLQVREVRDRHEQLATGHQHAVQLGERAGLILVRQVLQHVQTECALERCVREWERHQGRRLHARRRVVGVDAADAQARRVLVDEDAFTAAGVEDARVRRERVEIRAHRAELGEIGRVVIPGRIGCSVVVPARRVFAAAHQLGVRHSA